MCVLPPCMHVYHVFAWCPQRQKGILHTMEVELQITGSHSVCARKQTPVLWQSS